MDDGTIRLVTLACLGTIACLEGILFAVPYFLELYSTRMQRCDDFPGIQPMASAEYEEPD